MSIKKSQHYVPQFYLKYFSKGNNEAQIGLYSVSKSLFVAETSLRNHAKEDFFYGKDGRLEDSLGKIETQTAPLLKEIIKTNTLPKKNTEEYVLLFVFSFLLAYRTKDTVQQMHEGINNMMNKIWSYDDRTKEFIGKYEIALNNPAAIAIDILLRNLPNLMDLGLKLFVNNSSTDFITSDNPAVLYNQFLEQRNHPGGHTGMLTKGLQVFLPLSPTHLLHFYDTWIYKVGEKKNDTILLNDTGSVNSLNALQYLNCNDLLFFNQNIEKRYIDEIATKYDKIRMIGYSEIKLANQQINPDGGETILFHDAPNNLALRLTLDNITFTKKAKQCKLSDYVVQFRNETLRYNRS